MFKKVKGSMYEHAKQKHGRYKKKSQIKLLEGKKKNEMKNTLDGNSSRLDTADQLTRRHSDRRHSQNEIEKKDWKNNGRRTSWSSHEWTEIRVSSRF